MDVRELIKELENQLAADEADGVQDRTVVVSTNEGREYETLGVEPDDSDAGEPVLLINTGIQV